MMQPFSERVTIPSTPSARRLPSASSNSGVWYRDRTSSVLAKIVSTVRERMSSMNSPRNRSTQNESDRVRATLRSAARALSPALERRFGRRSVPHVAFEIDDLRRFDQGLVDVHWRQIGARAEISVHRPLAVRRDIDEAAPRARSLLGGQGRKSDAGRADVVREGCAERVLLHLADIGG